MGTFDAQDGDDRSSERERSELRTGTMDAQEWLDQSSGRNGFLHGGRIAGEAPTSGA
jgi:hypothetical protein